MVIMRKRLLQIPNFKKFKWYLRLHLDIGMNKKKCKEHLYFCSTLNIFSALNNYRLFLAKINIVFLSDSCVKYFPEWIFTDNLQ